MTTTTNERRDADASGGFLRGVSAAVGATGVALAAPVVLILAALPIVLAIRAIVEGLLWLIGRVAG